MCTFNKYSSGLKVKSLEKPGHNQTIVSKRTKNRNSKNEES